MPILTGATHGSSSRVDMKMVHVLTSSQANEQSCPTMAPLRAAGVPSLARLPRPDRWARWIEQKCLPAGPWMLPPSLWLSLSLTLTPYTPVQSGREALTTGSQGVHPEAPKNFLALTLVTKAMQFLGGGGAQCRLAHKEDTLWQNNNNNCHHLNSSFHSQTSRRSNVVPSHYLSEFLLEDRANWETHNTWLAMLILFSLTNAK